MTCIWIFLARVKKNSENWNPPQKISFRRCDFWGLRLSLGHFGRQAPERPVSQLQNGVSTYPLPPFIVGLLTFKNYPRSNSFFVNGNLRVC